VKPLRQRLKENGLSLAMFALFFLCLVGQAVSGWHRENEERRDHGRSTLGFGGYLVSGDFIEATFENWESEFFQMAALMTLSSVLMQKGSAQSKDLNEARDRDEEKQQKQAQRHSPWPVRRGGWALAIYQRSLSLALFLLFALSFTLHAVGGRNKFNLEAAAHGSPSVSLGEFVASSAFWFQSFQNWQSEFLSIGVLVVLSIFLRQAGSPESKPVNAPHAQTGV
jgi:hypothetical protein